MHILFKTIPKADSYIKNSFQLIDKLKRLYITNEYKLISLDVISLFPIDIAVDCVNEQWSFISKECSLPKNEFLGAIRFILDSTFFLFDNKIYKQSFGTPMGSPLSRVIANLVMRRLERSVSLMSLNVDILFYHRYVDDICIAVSPQKLIFCYNVLIHFIRLQFAIEKKEEKN